MGGKVLFDEVERRLVHRDDVMNLLPPRSWDLVKSSHWARGPGHRDRLRPTEKDPAIAATCSAAGPPRPGRAPAPKLLELLEYLCGNENNATEIYDWILKWLAYPLQHRGAKMHSAIVVHGPRAPAKAGFSRPIQDIRPLWAGIGQEALEDKFNADWAEKAVHPGGRSAGPGTDMYHIKNRLKGFITGDTIRVNPKNVAAHTEKTR